MMGHANLVGIAPRLLTVDQAAAHLNLSRWSVYDYLAAGRLQAVALPARRPREGDRATLDAFVDSLVGSGARLDHADDAHTRHGKHGDAHTAAEDGSGSGHSQRRGVGAFGGRDERIEFWAQPGHSRGNVGREHWRNRWRAG